MSPDFGGYVTRVGLCTDGHTITHGAFDHLDGTQVPLVWRHDHTDPKNVLGHVVLTKRNDGIYGEAYFNRGAQAQVARELVEHGDSDSLSIFANGLKKTGMHVTHGQIREVSLVLAGANPGAKVDYVKLAHSDGDIELLDDEAIIYHAVGENEEFGIEYYDDETGADAGSLEHADDEKVKLIYESMSSEQKNVVHYMIGAAVELALDEDAVAQGENDGHVFHEQEGSTLMGFNVFDTSSSSTGTRTDPKRMTISHEDAKGIAADAMRMGSLKAAVENYAITHGIEDVDLLFPDAKSIADRPEFDKRRTEWVAGVLSGVRKTPFSKIKSLVADITQEEARARGYITGNYKKAEWFGLTKRTTSPTSFYKKQQLDRDTIIDASDFDIVAWVKAEMRLMLDEEIARAILIGDGREVDDPDHIRDPMGATDGAGIRAIANDHELYAPSVFFNLNPDSTASYKELIDTVALSKPIYKGSGSPTFYTTEHHLGRMLRLRDEMGRRLYQNVADLASDMRVSNIVPVEVMESRPDLIGIYTNLTDYNVGTDRGGEISMFDDFDIDYNQFKYLMEGRSSGALIKIRSAIVFRAVDADSVEVVPTAPTFEVNVVTVPTVTGVTYKNADTDATLTTGSPVTLTAGQSLSVVATPNPGYHFETNLADEWVFTHQA